MKNKLYGVVFLGFAIAAIAQCPVSGDASTCTTPTQSSSKPANAGSQKPARPASSQSKAAGNAAQEESITRTQADAILVELKEIRALLQKQQPSSPAIDFSKIDFEGTPVVKVGSNDRRDNIMGKEDAPVVLVEFSDYQCPHCARFHTEMFDAIKKKYIDTGKVQFVSRDLPLAFHPWAMIAAEASHCAGEQGQYWQMRDWLMQHSEQLSAASIEQGARSLPLDMPSYDVCIESRKYYSSVRADADAALAVQIVATPAFIVGRDVPDGIEGKRKFGAGSAAELEALIDEALNAKK